MTPVSSPTIPDTKDWTWVLDRPCPECGFDPGAQALADLPALLHDTAMVWSQVLRNADVATRPASDTWSPLEYACHVRDVQRLFAGRIRRMLEQDTPTFADWDQDQAAVEEGYGEQQPFVVDVDLIEAAGDVAGLYASVRDEDLHRRGRRSDGMEFTVETLGRYHLHEVVHHLHDVGWDPSAATIKAYDAFASAYALGTAALSDHVRELVELYAAALSPGARVLEVGSGPGRDAHLMEQLGLRVRRTDISPGFVDLMRSQDLAADVVDPLHDDLSSEEGPYDAVWANACLLHVARGDLPTVLTRLADVTAQGGLLHLGLKEGDGEGWSTHGPVGAPRHFVYWREAPLREAVTDAGWQVDHVRRGEGLRGDGWLEVRAHRAGDS